MFILKMGVLLVKITKYKSVKGSHNYFLKNFRECLSDKVALIYWVFIFKISESMVEEENSFSENQPFPSLKMVSSLDKLQVVLSLIILYLNNLFWFFKWALKKPCNVN